MRVAQMFLLFSYNSFFFVYRHSDIERSYSNWSSTRHVNLVGACGPLRDTKSLWHSAAWFETFTERNCWAYDGCAWKVSGWTEAGFPLVVFRGRGGEYCWNRRSSNFSFRKKFVIVLPCCLLVENNTFSEMCIFKSLTSYTDDGCYETCYVLITIKSKTMQSLCWLF